MKLLTVRQAAKILQVTGQTVRNLITRGELKKVNVGRAVRVQERDLQEYIEQNTVTNRPERQYKPQEDIEYISTKEASRRLNKSLRVVQRYVKDGKLEGFKDGKEWRISQQSVNKHKGGQL